MEKSIDLLVGDPFRRIVSLGTAAVENAGLAGDESMLQAAQGLVKEGERALKKLEELCQRYSGQFGASFTDAVNNNDEISQLIDDLENMVYDFDDYVRADSFDHEKVSELQGLSKKTVLSIRRVITHMRLEPAHTDPSADSRASSVVARSPIDVGGQAQDNGQPKHEHVPHPKAEEWEEQVKYAGSLMYVHRGSGYGEPSRSLSDPSPSVNNGEDDGLIWAADLSENEVRNDRRERHSEPVSPRSGAPWTPPYSVGEDDPSPHVPPLFTGPSPAWSAGQSSVGLEPINLPPPFIDTETGLIPVNEGIEDYASSRTNSINQLGACTMTLSSSFFQFKGFCPGAVEAIHGGEGIKRMRKQSLTTTSKVAKCKDSGCSYELEWGAVIRDINCEATENLTSKPDGIGFRLRFLSKSHLQTKDVEEELYGCLFCFQVRHTTDANDATVFFSERQLFAHLARHPRPLPEVPGLTVVEDQEIPPHLANNYDLHLPNHILKRSPLFSIQRDLASLPTATALQTTRPAPPRPTHTGGAKTTSTNEVELASFAIGAKCMGIKFFDQGRWCMGWVDHTYGAISAEAIQLDPPLQRKNNARWPSRGSSNMKAVARWRFSVKEKEKLRGGEWLCFSKGEVITSIGWSYQDHWCWWGTNSKGKSGMFPRCFIDSSTLMEADEARNNKERRSSKIWRIPLRHLGASS